MDINIIKRIVSDTTQCDLNDEEKNKRRIREHVDNRRLYFSLCRKYTPLSLAEIGRSIKPKKDHATVLYNIRQLDDQMLFNKILRNKYENLRSRIEYVKSQVDESSIDFVTALNRLEKMEVQNKKLMGVNTELLNQIDQLNGKIKRQNKYLVENGYKIGMSIFKED